MSWSEFANRLPTLKLSVVVIAYNMERELPRTLKTLSSNMQKSIDSDDYEVIVVDNGSHTPVCINDCKEVLRNVYVHRIDNPSVSPVSAINAGIQMARGEFIGVFIDGARMASPGILSSAINGSRFGKNTVIGTLAFHLGPDVQMKSIFDGYDQSMEDKLLETCQWERDGYQLFTISVFAGASGKGWFNMPNESNALFMHREQWYELRGYDPLFESPGGGLSNHDMWSRACEHSPENVIILFGEGTFHQVHGGVATNAIVSKKDLFHS